MTRNLSQACTLVPQKKMTKHTGPDEKHVRREKSDRRLHMKAMGTWLSQNLKHTRVITASVLEVAEFSRPKTKTLDVEPSLARIERVMLLAHPSPF